MHVNDRAFGRPIKQPFRVGDRKVHASVTHRRAEVAMPGRAVQAVAFIKIHRVWHIGKIITGTRHVRLLEFDPDLEFTGHGRRHRGAGRNDERIDDRIALVGVDHLMRQVNVNPADAAARFAARR